MTYEGTPFVSVIVPVYNDQERIATCIGALLDQSYPRDRYEVIVVDNGSKDATREIAKRYPVTVLSETATQGSYAARNTGLEQAIGAIIAFTDSDCTPSREWLAEGVGSIQAGADLLGGNVRFVFSAKPSGAEVCDSIANMQIERNIRERGVAKTANLFARREVFEKIGNFPNDLQSGGDVIWTKRATANGFSLVYNPRAEVGHPTRRLGELLKKHYRVGRGQHAIRATERANPTPAASSAAPSAPAKKRSGGKLGKLTRSLRGFLPDPISTVRTSMRQNQVEHAASVYRVWLVSWLARATTTVGNLSASVAKPKAKPFVPPKVLTGVSRQLSLNDLLVESSRAALALQQADGSFPAGQNGPYADWETPVRNTAHWLLTLLRAYEASGDEAFRAAAVRAADYLTSQPARPMDASFLCRTKPERDFNNGLMGQAWAIEALAAASEKLGDPRYLELARKVFLMHPFDKKADLWRCVNVEGSYAPFDMTFNHQLWFAASGGLLDNDPKSEVGSRVVRFLDRTLESHLKVDPTGRVTHFVPAPKRRSLPKRLVAQALQPIKRLRKKPKMVHKEIGYHSFNLYAFSLLKRRFPNHPLWRSEKFLSALRFVMQPEYIRGLENNEFSYAYNPPGFEVAFAMQTFPEIYTTSEQSDSWWVSRQLLRAYDSASHMHERQTVDPRTLAARLYEASRLNNIDVQL